MKNEMKLGGGAIHSSYSTIMFNDVVVTNNSTTGVRKIAMSTCFIQYMPTYSLFFLIFFHTYFFYFGLSQIYIVDLMLFREHEILSAPKWVLSTFTKFLFQYDVLLLQDKNQSTN